MTAANPAMPTCVRRPGEADVASVVGVCLDEVKLIFILFIDKFDEI